jgi:protein required for attachment to host cells
MLEEAAEDNEADLVIVAPPQFLGSLRDHLSVSVKRRLLAEIEKDLAHHETDDVAEAISRHHEKNEAQ